MDPRNVLATGSDRSSGSEPERKDHAREGAFLGTQDNSDPGDEDAYAGLLCIKGRCFPVAAQVGQEVIAGRGVVINDFITAVAVVSDCAGRDEDRRARS
jgi:hypothetical protein